MRTAAFRTASTSTHTPPPPTSREVVEFISTAPSMRHLTPAQLVAKSRAELESLARTAAAELERADSLQAAGVDGRSVSPDPYATALAARRVADESARQRKRSGPERGTVPPAVTRPPHSKNAPDPYAKALAARRAAEVAARR